jgi:diguanylate cyclase (GGDEF)-like protein
MPAPLVQIANAGPARRHLADRRDSTQKAKRRFPDRLSFFHSLAEIPKRSAAARRRVWASGMSRKGADVTSKSRPDVFATPARGKPVEAATNAGSGMPSAPAPGNAPLDPARILASVGEVPYEWCIDSDRLAWGGNVAEVLKLDASAIGSGAAYAALLDARSTENRMAAVIRSERRDEGAGVPYTIQYCLRPDGSATELWVEDSGRWFAGGDARPVRAHGVVRVINDRHQHEQRLDYLSRFDALTGQLNRWHLMQVLAETLDEAARLRGSCGFLLVAIDNLHHVNECYGFNIADEVIAAVGRRVQGKLRGGDSLGRLSGNRFGVVLRNCGPDDLRVAANRLAAGVRDTMAATTVGPVAATVTIGGVIAPRHARTADDVLARAQEALGRAKAKRRGSFQAYRPSVEREAQRRENVRATDEIVAALNERRISLAFEPVARTGSREIAFYECLMRVQRPDGTLLPANKVVPAAERLGLVRLLDHRVLELVVNELIAAPDLCASINVSPHSTTDPDWWAGLDAHLRTRPGVAERLIVEITETAAIHDVDETRGFVARVKDLGCRLAIDDFGAGYTSFRNLRKLGVDIVKVEGAFVQNILQSEDDRAFVETLIALASRLGLATVAEWVQDEEVAAALAGCGCDYLQGQLIGLASPERYWAAA